MPGQHSPQGWVGQVWVGTASAVVLAVSMTGCATAGGDAGGGEARTVACVDWVLFENPADAVTDATAVVRTTGPTASAGTTDLFGVDANVHSVEIADVLKGTDLQVGQPVDVASTPVTCTAGGVYPDGDPLDASGSLIVLLSWDDDAQVWRTITPSQGVVAATVDDDIPLAWPTP